MELKRFTLITAVALGMFACGGNTEAKEPVTEEAAVETTEAVEAVTYTVNAASSFVGWKGEVAGAYGHNGSIAISEGSLDLAGKSLVGGKVVVDMTTIVPLDSASYKPEDSEDKGKASELVGHLSTGDFFLVETYPTATFVIKSMTDNKIVGDLTIRDKTNEETVDVSEFNVTEEGVSAKGTLVFDRQKYDVAWKHYMKDMILSDDIALELSIEATK